MFKKFSSVVLLSWFIIGPFFWLIDISKGGIGYYDLFGMAPLGIIHLIVFFGLFYFSVYFNTSSLLNVSLLACYYPMILLTNYPYLTFRDVYLHGGPIKIIAAAGSLNGTNNDQAGYWPSSFTFQSALQTVTGQNELIANYLLFFALLAILILVLYLLTNYFKSQGYALAWVCPLLFIALFHNHEFTFNHYARWVFSFILLLFFMFCYVRFRDRKGVIIQCMLIFVLATIHPYISLFLAIFYPLMAILYKKRNGLSRSIPFALTPIVIFLSWSLFNAGGPLYDLTKWLRLAFSNSFFKPLQSAPYVFENLSDWGGFLRNFYKYSLFALLAVALLCSILIIIMTWRRPQKRSIPLSLSISTVVVSIVFGFFVLLIPYSSIYRVAVLMALPASFSAIICLNELLPQKFKVRLNSHKVRLIVAFLVTSILLATSVLSFEKNFFYGEIRHESELFSLSFLFCHAAGSSVIYTDFKTAMYSNYYNFEESTRVLYIQPLKGQNFTTVISAFEIQAAQSNIMLSSFRFLEYASSESDVAEFSLFNNNLSYSFVRAYDNGNSTIFLKPFDHSK